MAELALTASPSEFPAHDLELNGRREDRLAPGSEKVRVGGPHWTLPSAWDRG